MITRCAVLLALLLSCGGCYTNRFQACPTAGNFAADALNNTAVTAVAAPALLVYAPFACLDAVGDALAGEAGCCERSSDGACPVCGDDPTTCGCVRERRPAPRRERPGRGPGY